MNDSITSQYIVYDIQVRYGQQEIYFLKGEIVLLPSENQIQ